MDCRDLLHSWSRIPGAGPNKPHSYRGSSRTYAVSADFLLSAVVTGHCQCTVPSRLRSRSQSSMCLWRIELNKTQRCRQCKRKEGRITSTKPREDPGHYTGGDAPWRRDDVTGTERIQSDGHELVDGHQKGADDGFVGTNPTKCEEDGLDIREVGKRRSRNLFDDKVYAKSYVTLIIITVNDMFVKPRR